MLKTIHNHKKIGLLGGSFNPAHEGHLYISHKALELLGLDEVWWILSPHNPLKNSDELWPIEKREASVQALIADEPCIKLSHIETEIATQYTVEAITALQQRHNETDFVWLMGEDNVSSFSRWHRWKDIADNVPIAVFHREGYGKLSNNSKLGLLSPEYRARKLPENQAKTLVSVPLPAWIFFEIQAHPTQATKIRKSLSQDTKKG